MPDVEIVSCRVSGNKLLAAMRSADLSQEQTARRVGNLTARQLHRFIKGEHCPSLERAVALSVVLGVPLEKLFKIQVKTRAAGWRWANPT
jgi:transcriptional regulator with XRE-family HTH domain